MQYHPVKESQRSYAKGSDWTIPNVKHEYTGCTKELQVVDLTKVKIFRHTYKRSNLNLSSHSGVVVERRSYDQKVVSSTPHLGAVVCP